MSSLKANKRTVKPAKFEHTVQTQGNENESSWNLITSFMVQHNFEPGDKS